VSSDAVFNLTRTDSSCAIDKAEEPEIVLASSSTVLYSVH